MKYLLLSIMILSSIFSSGAQNVKVYKGNSRYSSDIICNLKDGKVYSGTSSYSSDIQFNLDGNLTIEEFVAVWHAVKYSW